MDSQTFLLLVLVVGMGAFMIWAQYRTKKRYQKQLEELQVGDPVITIGGIYAKVVSVKDDSFVLCVDEKNDVRLTVSKTGISGKIGGAEKAP